MESNLNHEQAITNCLRKQALVGKRLKKKNPKKNEEEVEKRRQEIQSFLEKNREAIEAEKLVVYMIDECHLLWGDICGYVWGKSNMRVEIPVVNERERQTYYGALNFYTREFIVQEYEKENTVIAVFSRLRDDFIAEPLE
jgi:hypothetical protein